MCVCVWSVCPLRGGVVPALSAAHPLMDEQHSEDAVSGASRTDIEAITKVRRCRLTSG